MPRTFISLYFIADCIAHDHNPIRTRKKIELIDQLFAGVHWGKND